MFLLEDVEYLRGPFGIWTIVKGERDFIGMVAVLLDGVGMRIDIHVLVVDEFLARVGLVGINVHGASAGLRKTRDADNVSIALEVHVVAGLNGAQRLQCRGVAGG